MTTLQLPTPPLFSFQECLWFLGRNYDDIMHCVEPEVLLKPFRVEGKAVLVEITEQARYLRLRVLQGTLSHEAELLRQVTELFDLTTDLAPFYERLRADPDLAFMAEQYHGLRLVGIPDLFEALCWSIIGQQINLTFAYRLKRRLVEAYGEPIRHQDQTFYLFPTPAQLAALAPEVLRTLQFSTRKAEYLIGIARAFTEGTLSKEILQTLPTTEAKIRALVAHKGIGEWTANYALMKSLKVPTCIPYGDVGLYNALRAVKGLPRRPSRPELDTIFGAFRGWEGYLTFYLWRTLTSPALKYPNVPT